MSDFLEQELRKLFGDGSVIHAPWFSGNDCRGALDADLRVKIQFTCCHVPGDFDALAITVLNRTGGEVDHVMLRVENIWAPKDKPGWTGYGPHINRDYHRNEYGWRVYTPAAADYAVLREAAAGYLNVYRSQMMERERPAPPVVPGRPAPVARPPRRVQNER